MRKMLFVMIPFIMFGCTKNYEMSFGIRTTYTVKDFFDNKIVASNLEEFIVCDANTGFLYYICRDYGMTPIIGENGNPLTLDEWKRKQIEKSNAKEVKELIQIKEKSKSFLKAWEKLRHGEE